MTTDEYERYVASKVATPTMASILGLSGEVGELLDLIKKTTYHGHEPDTAKAIKEMGDILFYLTDISTRYFGVTLQMVMHQNVEKLDARYAKAFTQEESINRKDND